MQKFIRNICLFCIPGFLFILGYLILDPFMVVRHYDNYYKQQQIPVSLNRDHISTRTYLQYRTQNHYNSFIFGNSRSLVYHIKDWKLYLSSDASCFHFDASSETLYGIYHKMCLIDRLGDHLENVLLVLDPDLLSKDAPIRNSHLFYPSPETEPFKHYWGFHWVHFMAYSNPKIAFAVCDYAINHKVKDYMAQNFLIKEFNVTYELRHNELRYDSLEHEIKTGNYYSPQQLAVFEGKQIRQTHPEVIGDKQYALLCDIAALLRKHRSHYKVILSPLYDQQKLHPKDKRILDQLFGATRIYDFTGVNHITEDYHNYYEDSHYRPCVAQFILHTIYHTEKLKEL